MPELPPASHECPAPDCAMRVPRHQFACPRDWQRLPAELRRAINETYRVNWPAHIEAMNTAIAWFEANAGEPS